MAWNRKASILAVMDDKDATKDAVYAEANTIFTATFIGMVIDRGRHGYRVDMEPDMDGSMTQEARSENDRKAMLKLNDVCTKVNHIVRSYQRLQEHERGVRWGLTPEFNRGAMIAGGESAWRAYAGYNSEFLKRAWSYLTQDKESGANTVYVGRGAYCGLVVDENGFAVAAMSTLRTLLSPDLVKKYPVDFGDRWLPSMASKAFTSRLIGPKNVPVTDPSFTWGMIGDTRKPFSQQQQDLSDQGMRFVPRDASPRPANAIVGYTHGMIRAIYECERLGGGRPYEMSLGVNTAKLASCMSCSLFMLANGHAPSASHLGRGESWLPLYHTRQHIFSMEDRPGRRASEAERSVLSAVKDAVGTAGSNEDLVARAKGALGAIQSGGVFGDDVARVTRKVLAALEKAPDQSADGILRTAEMAVLDAARKAELLDAIRRCNERWELKMRTWMWTGVLAMQAQKDWIADSHIPSLEALADKLGRLNFHENPMACANLYLDAMTCHASDADRLNAVLKFGPSPRPGCEYSGDGKDAHATADWLVDSWRSHPWMLGDKPWLRFVNPFTNEFIKEFQALPPGLQK